MTFRMRPSGASPTGTVIGPDVSTTSKPRSTPSVDDMTTAIVRAPENLEHIGRVVGRVLHCGALRTVKRGRVLYQRAIHAVSDVRREERRENLLRGGEEQIVPRWSRVSRRRCNRQDAL